MYTRQIRSHTKIIFFIFSPHIFNDFFFLEKKKTQKDMKSRRHIFMLLFIEEIANRHCLCEYMCTH
jgi:hypothetical protein